MSQWAPLRIGDIGELFDGPHATPKSKGKVSTDYIFLSISSLENGRLNLKESPSISEEDYLSWTRRVTPRAQDLVFSYETRLGEGALIPAGLTCCLGRRMALLRPNQKVIEPRFLLYLFLGPKFQQTIAERTIHGSTVNRIALNDFPDFPILLPDITEQRRIAGVLGALDDKIESNRAQQHLGEQLVRALIERIIDQFSGADFTTLDAYCTHLKESVQPENLVSGDKYIALEHMPRGSVFLNSWTNAEHAGISSNKTRFRQGDLLFGKLRPYFKKVGVAPVAGVCSTDILVVRPRLQEFLPLITVVASSDALINSVSASATGTRMPRASWKDISKWPVPRIADETLITLLQPANQLIAFSQALSFQNIRLAEVRDALLPELMSGRMRVDEAGCLVSEALDEEVRSV